MNKIHSQSRNEGKDVKTFFVGKNDQVTIICPACANAKTIPVNKLPKHQFSFKARCNCDHTFMVKLDFRKSYRKSTNIPGIYSVYHPKEDEGPAKVIDVSLNGICFEAMGNHSLKIGQKGFIDFMLDNKRQTRLKKEFAVRSVNGNIFGCEFVKEQAYEKDLGFYLRPGF